MIFEKVDDLILEEKIAEELSNILNDEEQSHNKLEKGNETNT